jgi:hypothetical protein
MARPLSPPIRLTMSSRMPTITSRPSRRCPALPTEP